MKSINEGINYVNANEGGLIFQIQFQGEQFARRCDTVEDGVKWVMDYGIADACYFSSDMDFATEHYFETDDGAKRMFKEIIEFASEAELA